MTCTLCPKIALYTAGKKFFCKDHQKEAVIATQKANRIALSALSAKGYSATI